VKLSISFRRLENVLYRENSLIAAEDVPILLDILCTESGQATPAGITRKIRQLREAREGVEPEESETEEEETDDEDDS
jgi:hypothetical protein